jgi:PhzF family phenazine biosynthesis protein
MELGPEIPFFQVDAFTDRAFHGSSAAIFLPPGPLDPRAMQLMAREMSLSETAFVFPVGDGWEIRWFTPMVEVSACGHATLAAGHVLAQEKGLEMPLRFESTGGPVTIDSREDMLCMTLPADVPEIALPPSGLLRALGCHEAVPVLRSRQIWVVRLSWQKEVEALTPNVPTMLDVDVGDGMLGVAVTAPGIDGADFVSRFFAPWVGIPEDPVTGLAHTALAPYWSKLLARTRLQARQLSAREGVLGVEVDGDQVRLFGSAVTVARGTMGTPIFGPAVAAGERKVG